MLSVLLDSLGNPNTRWVMAGAAMLGASSGMLGAFALLRRRSLMGDVLAHAALPGVCLAFVLTGAKDVGAFMLGAAIVGLLATWCLHVVRTHSRLKEDTALAVVLSVFFGVGIVLLTRIQQGGSGNKAGLDKFLFGQAASLVGPDLRVMLAVSALLVLVCVALYKEFKLLCFDPNFGRGIGLPIAALDFVLMGLLVLAVVVGLQSVGVVLVAAMLITPAACARFWTERLGAMVPLAAAFGALSAMAGTSVSTLGARLPTGPLIVLAASAFFVLSLALSPRRGILGRVLRMASVRGKVAREHALRAIYEHAEESGDWRRPFSLAEVREHRPSSVKELDRALGRLARKDLVEGAQEGWVLTEQGLAEAYAVVRRHRLWEMYLMYEGELGAARVDRDADTVEHFLSPETVRQLEELLELHQVELKMPPSVHPLA